MPDKQCVKERRQPNRAPTHVLLKPCICGHALQVLDAGGDGDAAGVDAAKLVHNYGQCFVQGAPELALEYYMQARCRNIISCAKLGRSRSQTGVGMIPEPCADIHQTWPWSNVRRCGAAFIQLGLLDEMGCRTPQTWLLEHLLLAQSGAPD